MCGIAGFNLNANDPIRWDYTDVAVMSLSLIEGIQQRGWDAVGLAWNSEVYGRKKVRVWKDDIVPADIPLRHLPGITNNAIFHTRMATKGSPTNNGNNHPIRRNHIIGVHNGVIDNDDDLFSELKAGRIAEVDSEAIFAVIERATNRGIDYVTQLERIEGRMAIAWIDAKQDRSTLHLARAAGSPLAVGQNKHGSLVFASTMKILVESMEETAFELTWAWDVPEGTYLRVVDGVIEETRGFVPNEGWLGRYYATAPKKKGSRYGGTHTYSRGVQTYESAYRGWDSWDDDDVPTSTDLVIPGSDRLYDEWVDQYGDINKAIVDDVMDEHPMFTAAQILGK